MKSRTACCSIFVLVATTAVADANTTITVGNHVLLGNTGLQAIQIFGQSNGDFTQGMDLSAEILDSTTIVPGSSPQANARYGYNPTGNAGIGPESAAGPKIEAIDIITGTIFASNNTGQQTVFPNDGHLMGVSVTTASGTVPTNGLLATIYIDATGIPILDLYTLSLNVPDFIPTDFAGSPGVGNIVINDGVIGDPEPSAFVLGSLGAIGFGFVAARKRRSKARQAN